MSKASTSKGPAKRKRKDSDAEEPTKKTAKKEPAKKSKATKSKVADKDINPAWEESQLLSENTNIDFEICKNIVNLFEEGNTIPFIARYRRNVTGDMSPETLRDVKEQLDAISSLKSKIKTVYKTIQKNGQMNSGLNRALLCARTMEELEHIYAPFKPEGKKTLSERAKALGLEKSALNIMNNAGFENLKNYVKTGHKELGKLEDVEKGVIHIIASVISSDTELLQFLRELRANSYFNIEVKKTVHKKETKKAETEKKDKTTKNKQTDATKYETYFDFKATTTSLKPHQILAINRGETQKVLTVKIIISDYIYNKYNNFCFHKWVKIGNYEANRNRLMNESISDAYARLVRPFIIREIRQTLKQEAEKVSCETFSKNLKQLLLAQPVKGKCILGIDPGFANGCKVAVISETGALLDKTVIYPHKGGAEKSKHILVSLMKNHECSLIALGNKTACRETEKWLVEIIASKGARPLDVSYTIVNEDGASIYSCSAEAKKEFPDLDPNLISAVSLARRVQEPLAELVKVEPHHLGVGMYQHDIKKKQLEEALADVVSECVSFVGVDLNTTSQCLLRRIAGLSDKRADSIIEHREKHGHFTHRKQLLEVRGIGAKIFEQCAGFLRVGPMNVNQIKTFYNEPKTTKLDCTYVHPESYSIANKIIKKLGLKTEDIGEELFIKKIQSTQFDIENLAKEHNSPRETIKLIIDTLSKPLNYDLRNEAKIEPLFKQELTNITDLKVGSVLTGRVANVTSFGCFVDIGVGPSGLIHVSKMRGIDLQLGDRVKVEVLSVEVERKRIGLQPIERIT